MKIVNARRDTTAKAVSFRGFEARLTGYEKEFSNAAPSVSLCMNDGKELIELPKFAEGRPFPEYFREKIGSMVTKSFRWHKNSSMKIIQDIKRTESVYYPASKYKKVENSYTGTMYKGNVYFGDLDEYVSPSQYRNYTVIVNDTEPALPSLRNLERFYADERDYRIIRQDNNFTARNKLEGILDYCTRRAENLKEKAAAEKISQSLFSANLQSCEAISDKITTLLNLVNEYDEAIAKGENQQIVKKLIEIRNFYKKQFNEFLIQNRKIFFRR